MIMRIVRFSSILRVTLMNHTLNIAISQLFHSIFHHIILIILHTVYSIIIFSPPFNIEDISVLFNYSFLFILF
jgi:hypothetical protein